MTEPREFRIGDRVTFTNPYGCVFPGKTITGTEVWAGYTEVRYFYAPSPSPWFSVPGSALTLEEER